jgi:hypothetical protein
MKRLFLLCVIFSASSLCAPGVVQAENEGTYEVPSSEYPGAINSIDGLNRGKGSFHSIARQAEYCVQNEQFDKAIKLSRMAIDRNDDDNEVHQVYAEALEGKLGTQTERDPMIFNQCVKEWLIVLRQEVGDEKLTCHGIGLPGLGHLYADDERVIPARKHLLRLTGRVPKAWETDDKYLKKVLMPFTPNVRGSVVSADSHSKPEAHAQSDSHADSPHAALPESTK